MAGEIDPTWLRVLASEDGHPLPSSMSIRPLFAEQLLAEHQQRLKRRSVLPTTLSAADDIAADARHLADVLDEGEAGGRPYYLIGRIGEGGMGVVHLARQRSTGREVAVKAVLPDRQVPAYLAAFRRECRITAQIEHPNVPPVYDAGADFMVMKRLTGRSLEVRLKEAGARERLAAHVEALIKVADALAFAHAQGVVHRDLKGENVMVGEFGEVWVMDWGLAAGFAPAPDGQWLASPIGSRQEMCAGTPMCAPPEVAIADPNAVGPGLDLFMFGALLYRVLSGRYPYESISGKESMKLAARRQVVPLLTCAPTSPFRLVQAVERAMAWEPEARGTLQDFVADLRTWLHTAGAAADADGLLARVAALVAEGEAAPAPPTRYRILGQAVAEADRALALCPELRRAHELARRARTAFAGAARAAGDRTLADLVERGFTPPV